MTSSLPKVPLWPRDGSRRQERGSGRVVEQNRFGRDPARHRLPPRSPGGRHPGSPGSVGRAELSLCRRRLPGQSAQPLEPPQQRCLALVEPLLDVGRIEEAAAGGPDPVRDRYGELGLVADRDGDAAHPELRRPVERLGRGAGPPADRWAAARPRCRASRCRGPPARAPWRRPPWPPSGRPSSRAGCGRTPPRPESGRAS